MIVKITPKIVEIDGHGIFGNFDEVEIEFKNGQIVQVGLNATEGQSAVFAEHYGQDFWIKKLLKASEEGDWRNVDRAIANLRIHYESPNHA